MSGQMSAGEIRELIGTILLCLMGIALVLWIIRRNWSLIKEICTDENGNFDPLGGLERHFTQDSSNGGAEQTPEEVTADEDFMQVLYRQKGAQMADFDPVRDLIREHIIFHGRVQGVGFRYRNGSAGNRDGDRQTFDPHAERPLDPDRQDGHRGDACKARRAGIRRQRILNTAQAGRQNEKTVRRTQ